MDCWVFLPACFIGKETTRHQQGACPGIQHLVAANSGCDRNSRVSRRSRTVAAIHVAIRSLRLDHVARFLGISRGRPFCGYGFAPLGGQAHTWSTFTRCVRVILPTSPIAMRMVSSPFRRSTQSGPSYWRWPIFAAAALRAICTAESGCDFFNHDDWVALFERCIGGIVVYVGVSLATRLLESWLFHPARLVVQATAVAEAERSRAASRNRPLRQPAWCH